MSDVILAGAVRSNLLALQQLSREIGIRQEHLATGKRVSSPFDDPTAYFTAAILHARAATLNTLLDGVGNAQKTLEAASNGIDAIKSLLQSAQSLANQALQSASSNAKVTGTNTTPLTTSTQIASTGGGSKLFKAGDTVTVSDGTTTATYTAANNDTVQTFLNAVNNTSGLKITASLTSDGKVQLNALSTNSITIGGSVSSPATLNAVLGLTAGTTSGTLNTTRQSLAQQFDAVRTQIDQAVQDAGYNGVNLLNGSNLTVTFNETGSSKLSVSGVQYSAANLGIAAVNSGTGNQFQSDTEVNTAISSITAALTTLATQSSVFGSNTSVLQGREDFTKAMVATLNTGADDLVAADSNEESAMLLALQTRQQIATTSLSLSTRADQAVLRLFGL